MPEALYVERIQCGRDYRNDRGVEGDTLPAVERAERLKWILLLFKRNCVGHILYVPNMVECL